MVSKEELSNMSNYDKYRAVVAVSHDIVKYSKGIGFNSLDKEKIMSDVNRAADIFDVAKRYWDTNTALHHAVQKQRAAKLLELDTTVYDATVEQYTILEYQYVETMDYILSKWRRSYNRGWVEDAQ